MRRKFWTSLILVSACGLAWSQQGQSETGIKKVMVYSKVGGWFHQEGVPACENAVKKLGEQYGFEVIIVKDENPLVLDNLKTFDVLIWNNNVNGQASVSNSSARQALLDYINQGGGWVGVHGAGDHGDTWKELADLIGTKFSRHGAQGNGDLTTDPEAEDDPELVEMVKLYPSEVTMHEEWYSFQNSVRGKPGTKVVATIEHNNSSVVLPAGGTEGQGNHPMIWAKRQGEGRVIYTAVGHRGDIYDQAQEWSLKALWAHMRYVAGDFAPVSGCTNPEAENFDPKATMDDGSCIVPVSISKDIAQAGATSFGISIDRPGSHRMRVRDVAGRTVMHRDGNGPGSYRLDDMEAGLYAVSVKGDGFSYSRLINVQ